MSKVPTTLSDQFLTEKKHLFLEALAGPARGDVREAMRLAGYAENSAVAAIVTSLKDEIKKLASNLMEANAVKASLAFEDVINNPAEIGASNKVMAAKELLDRIGLGKKETPSSTQTHNTAIFILPPKAEINVDKIIDGDYTIGSMPLVDQDG